MKRVIALLLCLVLSVCCLAACGDDTPDEVHSHTYSETWSSDAVGHWYEPTCDCADAPFTKLGHADKNNDKMCDICEYTNHTHTYSDGWTVDCTNHWNAADCGCTVAGTNVAAHADTNADGKCDVCNYVINDIHVHYYDTAWTCDSEYHWHAALCEHGVEVADKAAHNINAAGYCTVCEAKVQQIDLTNIEKVLAAAGARNDKVTYGDVIATESVYGGTGAETLENGKTNKVHFALGNGESYIQYISFDINGNYIGQEEQWFEDLGNDDVFAVAMLNGNYELSPIAGAAQFLNGYNYIPGSIIPSDSADTSTLANMLSALYDQMKAGVRVSNAAENVENGVYTFSYTYYSVNPATTGGAVYNVEIEYYNVDVEFTVNADLIIDAAEFQVEVYRDFEGDSDLSYTYVDNGDGTVTINDLALKSTANPSFYTYAVAQTSGERTFTTPYPRVSLIPSSFELLYVLETEEDDNGNPIPTVTEPIGDTMEIVSGTYAKFAIGDIFPITASSKFLNSDDFIFSFVNNDPDSEARAWYMDEGSTDAMLNGYSSLSGVGMLKLKIQDAGEYTVTLGFGDVIKTFTLKVTAAAPEQPPEDTDSAINVTITDNNTFADLFSYTASKAGTYTFTIPEELSIFEESAFENWGQPIVDRDDPNNTITGAYDYELVMAEGDVFSFYAKAAVVGTYTINVAYSETTAGGGDEGGDEPPTVNETDLAIGHNQVSASNVAFAYTAATNGKLTVSVGGFITMGDATATAEVTYTVNGGTATTIAWNSSADLDLVAGDKVVITVMTNAYGTVTAAWEASSTGGEEGGDTTEVEISGTIYTAIENHITVTDDHLTAGKLYASFMPFMSGEYDIYSADLGITAITSPDGTVIEKNDNWFYELDAYVTYTVEISTNWISAAGDYTVLAEYQYPEGTQENPIWLYSLDESVTASYAGDYAPPIWYQFYANATGTLTLSTEQDNVTLMLTAVFGKEITNEEWDDDYSITYKKSITLDVVQGRKYYIGVMAVDACDIVFNASIAEGEITTDGTANVPHNVVIGANNAIITGYDYVYFMYTATANGTVTFTTDSTNYAWFATDDLSVYVEETTGKISKHLGMDETIYLVIGTADSQADEIPFTATWTADPVEVYYENTVITDGSAANEIVIENSNTYVSLYIYGNGSFILTWDNVDAIVEVLAWGAPNTAIVNGGTISAGMFGANLMVYLPGYAAGTVNLTITPNIAPAQDLVVGDNTVSVTDTNNGANATFTAPEAGTYLFTVGANGVVDNGGEFFFENDVITVALGEGESVSFIVLTYDYSADDISINVALQGATTPGEGGDEGGEEEGGNGETSSVVTYMSAKNTNGRYMKVEIDVANGTMTITRSSDTGSFDGQTVSTFSYSYDATTKTVTYVADGSTSVTSVAFDENGAPTSVTYNGMAYTDYTVQA